MKELKFKAWLKELGHMVDVYEIVFTQKGCSIRVKGYDHRHYRTFKQGEFILRQFIGRHDKNEVEIYEGDVFEVTDGDEWVVGHELAKMDADTLPVDEQCVGEILGNNCENPELMEGEEPCQPPL